MVRNHSEAESLDAEILLLCMYCRAKVVAFSWLELPQASGGFQEQNMLLHQMNCYTSCRSVWGIRFVG